MRTATAWFIGLSAVLVLGTGCAGNKRITVRELIELEASMARPIPSKQVPPAATTTQPAKLALPEITRYRLVAGDKIAITILGMDDLDPTVPTTLDLRVQREGTLKLPYGLEVAVADLELEDAERAIHDALVPRYFKELVVTVQVEEYMTTTVIVYGAVMQPGPLALRDNQRSVLYALFGPGGFSAAASGVVKVQSIRGREHNATYDVRNPADLRRALTAPSLESGDIIVAETERPNIVYFTGLLNGGGPIAFTAGEPVTFLQALAAAGGRDPITDPIEGILRRKLPTGDEVEVELPLKELEKGKEPNFEMRPGDLVMVPHTFRTRALEFLNQSIRFSAGASATVNYDPLTEDRFDRQLDTQDAATGAFSSPGLTGLPDFFTPAFPAAPAP